jgi:hypothetical protein
MLKAQHLRLSAARQHWSAVVPCRRGSASDRCCLANVAFGSKAEKLRTSICLPLRRQERTSPLRPAHCIRPRAATISIFADLPPGAHRFASGITLLAAGCSADAGGGMIPRPATANTSPKGPDRKKVGFSLVERLGFRVARSPFSGGSTMTRHLFFAITLIGTGVLLNSPAEAVTSARCEDQAANCVGGCANPNGGANQNKCMRYCDRQVTRCMIRAYDAARRAYSLFYPTAF